MTIEEVVCVGEHVFFAVDEMFSNDPPPRRFLCDCGRREIEVTLDRNRVWRFRVSVEEPANA